MLLCLLWEWSVGKPKSLFEVCLGGAEGVGHTKEDCLQPPEQLDDTSLCLRYISQQSFVTRAVSFSTQDLLILFGSFGMALFALNLYKLTKPVNG